ncbi:hypothetical protein Sjap_018968 [Stephania japonica]|uniref:Reverse transcriptase n=1 Tax=Stephania japonica TaxID=461633 RepID=A0AAP0HZ98_9MAGN
MPLGGSPRDADFWGCKLPSGCMAVKISRNASRGSPRDADFWEPVLRKIARRIDGWKRGFLSKGGRLTLIVAVLDSLPTCYMYLYWLAARIANKVEKMMRDFLWKRMNENTSWALVAWKQVSLP